MSATLLVREVGSRQEVVAACEVAQAAGVIPVHLASQSAALAGSTTRQAGMTLAHARALLGSQPVRVLPSDPVGDRQALQRLAAWATRYVPLMPASVIPCSHAFRTADDFAIHRHFHTLHPKPCTLSHHARRTIT